MADNFEHPGPGDSQGGSPTDPDFPADFFDDAVEPSPASMTPHEPSQALPPVAPPPPVASTPPAGTARPPVNEPPPPVVGPPSSYRAPGVEPIEDEGLKTSAFPTVLGVVMLGVLTAAWFTSRQPREAQAVVAAPTPPAAPVATDAVAPTPTPLKAVDADALEEKVKGLTGKVDGLTAQIKAFEGKLNELPRPEPAPDVKPLEGKLNDLTRSVAAVAPLDDKVGKLGDRVGSVHDELKSVKGELASLKEEVRKTAAASAPPTAAESKAPTDETATALNGGIDLFKAGKYKEADEVFKKLVTAGARDARVYYYAALTRGLTTKDWQGETLTTAARGAELEKAGSPRASDVDTAFNDLPANLKPWVTFFRQKSK